MGRRLCGRRPISFSAMDMHNWIGYAAATLTTASFVPQAWLIFKTRNVTGISTDMYSVFTVSVRPTHP